MKVGQAGVDVGDSILWPNEEAGAGFLIVRLLATEDGDRTFEIRYLESGHRDFLTDLDFLDGAFVVVKQAS